MRRRTTTQKIGDVLANRMLRIIRAEIYDKSSGKTESIDTDKFRENFDYLCETGAFMDYIGWWFEKNPETNTYIIETGRTNWNVDNIVTAYLRVCDGVDVEGVEKMLIFEEE